VLLQPEVCRALVIFSHLQPPLDVEKWLYRTTFSHKPKGPQSLLCGGLTLAGCQVPTKATRSLLSSAGGQQRENTMKGSWVEMRTGRWLSNYHHRQNRLDSGKINFIYYQSNQTRIVRNKT